MAYVVERTNADGMSRFLANYRDPEGRIRSAGTFPSRRAAERAANREEQRVLAGNWRDHTLGAVPFQQYVERDWLQKRDIEPDCLDAYPRHLEDARHERQARFIHIHVIILDDKSTDRKP